MSLNLGKNNRDFNIGIVTLVGNFNYGNRLQAFATYTIYEKLGLSPVHLDLKKRFIFIDEVKGLIKRLLGIKSNNPENSMTQDRLEAFKRFNGKMETVLLDSTHDAFLNQLEYISIGSDQVWNPLFIKHYEDWFTGSFFPDNRKIALSPSIGLDELNLRQKEWLAAAINSFSCVSIREKRGAELIKECSGVDAEVICDPTLVLTAEEWRAHADGRCTPREAYVFTYLLGGLSAEASEVLDEVTNHGRIQVIPLSDRQKPCELNAGPAEFIDLIDHAQHVVTDSFHAAVFSVIMHTPLTIVHREGGESMFSRLDQLSRALGIEDKVYGSPSFNIALAGEYEGVSSAIDAERAKFLKYLEGCLDG